APRLYVVPEEELAGGDQADALERAQVRAGRPRQQGLPVPHQEVSSPQAQREGLAGLGSTPPALQQHSAEVARVQRFAQMWKRDCEGIAAVAEAARAPVGDLFPALRLSDCVDL